MAQSIESMATNLNVLGASRGIFLLWQLESAIVDDFDEDNFQVLKEGFFVNLGRLVHFQIMLGLVD